MVQTLKNVKTCAKLGALLKLAKSDYQTKKISRKNYLEILKECEIEARDCKDKVNTITNQIKIPFNF
jgi:hypothetical protein